MAPIIQAEQLRREYFIAKRHDGLLGSFRGLVSRAGRTVVAVDDIDLTMEEGEFVAYLGPNGAGKSTTIKMLTGILAPTRGRVRVAGFDPQERRSEVAKRIGVVFGQRTQLWWDLPVLDSYEILQHMYRVPPALWRERLDRLTAMLGMGAFIDAPVRSLSLGQRMRAELAGALLHQPPVLFLDEPTIGLDIQAKESIREFLAEINRQGTTILMTTHDLGDIERLCKRIVLINQGRIRYDGGLAQLRQTLGLPTVLEVDFGSPVELTPGPIAGGAADLTPAGPLAAMVRFDRNRVAAGAVINALNDLGDIRDIRLREPAIEEVIKTLYGA